MDNTVLLGFDLLVIFTSIVKLAHDYLKLSEGALKLLGALAVTVAVVIVGLHGLNPLFPPEMAGAVTLVLTAITAFLGAMGYGPGLVGAVRKAEALLKWKAYEAALKAGAQDACCRAELKAKLLAMDEKK